jgi:hypothetical protein
MAKLKQICSQQIHCLSCPLSVKITGKECDKLTQKEIDAILTQKSEEIK